MLIVHDSDNDQEIETLQNLLARSEMEIEIQQIQKLNYHIPELYTQSGAPKYSHIVLYVNQFNFDQQSITSLADFANGNSDPIYSKLSNYEKETIPEKEIYNNNTKKLFQQSFEPYPGGNLMIITEDKKVSKLLEKIGGIVVETQSIELSIKGQKILRHLKEYENNFELINNGIQVVANYYNKRTPYNIIYGSENGSIIACWRGVQNNARIMFIGNKQLVQMMISENDIQSDFSSKLMFDLSGWFIMQNDMVRITEFNHTVIDLPENSPCKQAMHLSKVTHDHVREGNLVLINAKIEEMQNKIWDIYQEYNTYTDFNDMVEKVGFLKLNNKNFQSLIKKQKTSFINNYDKCMQEVIGNDYVYTDIQLREPFIQDWYTMNMVYSKSKQQFYALIVPDLVRSYTLSIDIDKDYLNRISIKHRVHAYLDHYEENRVFLPNLLWQINLILVILLAVVAMLLKIFMKNTTSIDQKEQKAE